MPVTRAPENTEKAVPQNVVPLSMILKKDY